jgi:hypothetical protein
MRTLVFADFIEPEELNREDRRCQAARTGAAQVATDIEPPLATIAVRLAVYSTRDSTVRARSVIILLGFPTCSNVSGAGQFPGWVANQSTNS